MRSTFVIVLALVALLPGCTAPAPDDEIDRAIALRIMARTSSRTR